MPYVAVVPIGVTRAETYTYAAGSDLPTGSVVDIPLAGRQALGVVTGPDRPFARAKKADPTGMTLSQAQLDLARWIAAEYVAPLGLALKPLVIRAAIRDRPEEFKPPTRPVGSPVRPELVIGPDRDRRYRELLATDRPNLWLVPEVAMTPERWRTITDGRDNAVVYHSRMTPRQRGAVWWRIAAGEPLTVIGARSSLFLPWHDLGTLIVDSEEDMSYKEEHTPTYHARAVAGRLAELTGAKLVYGSAAPSLETYRQAVRGTIRLHKLGQPALRARIVDRSGDPSRDLIGHQGWQALETATATGRPGWVFAPARYHHDLAVALRPLSDRVAIMSGQPSPDDLAIADGLIVGGPALSHLIHRPVVIVVARTDTLLQLPDFRAAEKAFAALTRLAERLGNDGAMLVETTEPDDPTLAALGRPYDVFAVPVLAEREQLKLPPFRRLTRIVFSEPSRDAAEKAATAAARSLDDRQLTIDVGPCPVERRDGRWRWQVTIKGDPKRLTGRLDRSWQVDVDPLDLL